MIVDCHTHFHAGAIQGAVFSQIHDLPARLGIAQARAYNDSIAKCVQTHGAKFRGVASLPLQDVSASTKEMERAVRELAMIGVMINPDPSRRGTSPTQEEEHWYPIYEKACELDVPLFIHPGSCALPRLEKYNLGLHLGFLYGETEFILTFIFG